MTNVRAPRRRVLVPVLVACLVAALGGLIGATTASANPPSTARTKPATTTTLPAPTSMRIESVSSLAVPGGVPQGSAPHTLVEAKGIVTIHLTFWDGTTAAAFKSDTAMKITSTGGTLVSSTGIAPAGEPSADITTSFKDAVNEVSLSVTVSKGPSKGLTTDQPSQVFDVLTDVQVKTARSGSAFTDGIGGEDGLCGTASKELPVCGILVLPHGATCVGVDCTTASIVLSTGLCDTATATIPPAPAYAPCRPSPKGVGPGSVIQVLFNDGGAYSKTDPATLIIKCDKSLCGGGAIQDVPLNFSLFGNDPLGSVPECPAKGVVGTNADGTDQKACIDYVQSKRDGAGDTHLYLLFPHDMRGSVG
jgi:hypothetical protein